MKSIFRKKTIENLLANAKKNTMKKTMGALDLVMFGVGCVIGTGIFVLTGIAAAEHAGPAISVSYLLAGIVCIFTGLAYAELAAAIPVAGSSYTYSYVIFGEFVAWVVGCVLICGYTMASATVAVGWSGYFVGILKAAGLAIPEMLTKSPIEGGLVNLPAVCVTLFIGMLLIRGTKESIVINRVLVAVKLVIIFLFIFIAAPHIKMENYADFMPYGWHGVSVGAATIFFAYVGFDAVATAAEETKNPNRDLPIGIIGSIIICAILYITVSLVLTGITHYSELNNSEPMAYALRQNGSNVGSALIATGAVAGMIAVILIMMYGQSRVLFVISRDGLISDKFSKIHKKFGTPYVSCLATMFAVALLAGFTPIKTLGFLTSLTLLFSFVIALIGVMVLRVRRPKLERPFRCPGVFFVAPVAIISCSYLIYTLLVETAMPFVILILTSVIAYFTYTYKKSPMGK
jgi:APA family basic amino acid/polyamine antiporter